MLYLLPIQEGSGILATLMSEASPVVTLLGTVLLCYSMLTLQSSSGQSPATYHIPLSNIMLRCSNYKWFLDTCTKHSLIRSTFKLHLALLVYNEFVKSVTAVTITHTTLSSGKSWSGSQISWKGIQSLPITVVLDLTSTQDSPLPVSSKLHVK